MASGRWLFKNMEKELIIVSNWEKVEADDYYLTDEWAKHEGTENTVKEARELQKNNNLYVGYIVSAVDYAIYKQMDSDQVFVDGEGEEIIHCETAIINNNHEYRREVEY